ncbi:PAS domain-containing protein [Brevundimonas sp. TWP2-3-4b1]|uniref:PAS domain-containing protein n=1 Tax=Brevundimonas sp. TWP2-3-4b1 TaxID=2804580 RepID=UPI003CFA9A80
MESVSASRSNLTFLTGGGEMGALMRAHDWSISPVGPPEDWPQSLRSVVGLMLANKHIMFVAWGPELVFLYNDAYRPVFGQKHPWALGRPFREVWSEVWDEVEPLVNSALGGEATWSENLHLVLRRNACPEDCWFTFSYSPVRDEDGAVVGLFCAATETTGQVLTEQRLKEQAERQRRLFEKTPGFIAILTGPDYTFEFVNEAYVQLAGGRDLLGRTVRDAFPDLAGQGLFEMLDGVYATGERFVAEGTAVTLREAPDQQGREVVLDFVYEPMRDEAGDVTGIFLEGHEVTEIRRAEATLRESEARYQALFAASPVPFMVLAPNAPDFTIIAANDAYFAATLTTRESLVGRRLFDVLPDDPSRPGQLGSDALAISLDRVLTTRTTDAMERVRYDLVTLDRGFEPHWWEAINAPMLDGSGEISAIIHQVTRVTELHYGEEAELEEQEHQAFLLKLGDALRAEPSAEAMTDRALRMLSGQMRLDRCYVGIYRLAEDLGDFPHQVHDDRLPSLPAQVRLSDFPEALRIAFDRTLVLDDVVEMEGLSDRDQASFDGLGIRALIAATLRKGENNPLWAIVAASTSPRVWTPGEVSLVEEVAERTWAAVERARAEAVLHESEARHRFRVELSDALRALTSPSGIMVAVAERLGPHLGVDQANYYFVDSDRFVVTDEWRTDASPGILGSHFLADFGEDTLARLRAGEVLRFDDTHGVEGEKAFAAAGIAAVLSVPLRRDGRWAAGLHVHQARPRVWTAEEEALVREVAAHAWAAVERARAQDDLRELNKSLEARVADALAERQVLANFVDSTDASVLACDLDYGVLAVNDATIRGMERLYGVRPKVGDNLLDVLASMPEHRVQVERHWNRALSGEEFVVLDEFGDPRRERAFYEVRFHPLRDRDGKRVGAFQAAYDVTDRVRAQTELEQTQEALRQSQKMEAMGQLTGGVAHDFNNLLTPIVGSLDMLVRRGVSSERERRLIDGALQSAERAKILVQRLLAFARRQPLQPVAVEISKLVEGMVGMIGSTLGPTIDVRVVIDPDLPPAKADPNQLEMALLNLAVNARDAMPDGGELSVTARRESVCPGHTSGLQPGDYVLLCVVDTGAGMDDATRQRAIEPFFSTKGVGKGTGLGLSMVHGLAAQLGGGLLIDSTPGKGTTIELWLPISTAAIDVQEASAATPATRVGRGVALLVDDEKLVRMSTADMLIDLGFEVVEAGTGEEALQLLKTGTMPDILITDHLMPGMSGVDLAREARAIKPTLPILIVSGYAEVDAVGQDLPRLTKPFRNAELAESISAVIPVGE